jgi:hypothetical protein
VSNPIFGRVFYFVRLLGAVIAMSNLATETAYLTSHKFSSIMFQSLYCGIVVFKAVLIVLIGLVMLKTKVVGKRPTEITYDMD